MTVLYTPRITWKRPPSFPTHIAIMDKGKVIAYGTHDELIHLVGEQTRIDSPSTWKRRKFSPMWRGTEGVSQIDSTDGRVTVLVDDSNRVLPRLFEAACAGRCAHHFRGYPGTEPGDGVPPPDRAGIEGLT